MLPLQQPALPPGRSPQPGPPHVPHDFSQHVVPDRTPFVHAGSAALGAAARRRAIEHYAIQGVVERYQTLYEEIADRHRR